LKLTKRIPMGGGLGGGSSNAAAILLALPALLEKPLPMDKLMELACALGSDVPFFLVGGTAVGIGRGTDLYPLPDLPESPALLVAPGVHVSTADAYRALDRGPTPVWHTDSAESYSNDFETVVFPRHPQLKLIQGTLLKLGARPALMSGSGSTMFGIFSDPERRDRAAKSFRNEFAEDKNTKVHPVKFVSRRGYRSLWRRQLAINPKSTAWPPQQDRYAE
jgi:4-diphosphocytidyl-2-C-methyl-D-erythritol kinase